MRTINKEEVIYTYEELSDDAKDKALADAYESYPESILTDTLKDMGRQMLEDTLPRAKFTDIDYNLSYGQGSGAVIEFSYDELDDFMADFPFINNYLTTKCGKDRLEGIDFKEDFDFSFKCICDNYYYNSKIDVDIDGVDYSIDQDYISELIFDIITNKDEVVYTKITKLNKEFTSNCYEYVENMLTKSYWEDKWFYADGSYAGTSEDFN